MDTKSMKKFYDVLIKISNVFNECFIFKSGHVIAANGFQFLIILKPEQLQYFYVFHEKQFDILYINNMKEYKKSVKAGTEKCKTEYSTVELSPFTRRMIINSLDTKVKEIKEVSEWHRFFFSDIEEVNNRLITEMFTKNRCIEFQPATNPNEMILLTKVFNFLYKFLHFC